MPDDTDRQSGRWGSLAGVREAQGRPPHDYDGTTVWIARNSTYYHYDSWCKRIFRDEYIPWTLTGMLSETSARRLGYLHCTQCWHAG